MVDSIANPNTAPTRYSPFWFRILEIIPGAIVWIVLIIPFIFAVTAPVFVTVFVLLFDLYWLMKSLTYGFILLSGYKQLNRVNKTDWSKELKMLTADDQSVPYTELYHAIILPTYRENKETLQASIKSVIDADYDKKRIIYIIATEERDKPEAHIIARELEKQYAAHFYSFFVTKHPDGIVGEVKAKGANATWAAKQLTQFVQHAGIKPDRVIVTTADADTRFTRQFFTRLSYMYSTNPDPTHTAYQPVPMYFNNIWRAPMVSRVYALGTTFFQLVESVRTYRLITFSTHAMSLETLQKMDYWCTSIVNEDSRQFFRGFFAFNGNFRVMPMYIPVHMDAVHVGKLSNSLRNLYLQQQRWAYGTEHFPYIALECVRRKDIPLIDRLAILWRQFEGNFSWATSSYFVTIVGWLPFLLSQNFSHHVIALNFQILTRDILVVTWIGLFISIYLTFKLLPPLPEKAARFTHFTMALQWVLVPFVAIFFGSIPAIDAQTRLMLGKYIGFRVTEKVTAT